MALLRAGLELARPACIGKDAWIGGSAIILGGVTIGDGAIVGTRGVTRRVEVGATVVGNPARPISQLYLTAVVISNQTISSQWLGIAFTSVGSSIPFKAKKLALIPRFIDQNPAPSLSYDHDFLAEIASQGGIRFGLAGRNKVEPYRHTWPADSLH